MQRASRALLTAISASAVLALPTTVLTANLEDEVRECSELTENTRRLACFDSIAERMVSVQAGSPSSMPDPNPPESAEYADEAEFGLPEIPAEDLPPSQIESRYLGEFRGWSGDTLFRLENGQIWRQAETGRMHWVARNPTIIIRRTSIGTYWLNVEGVNARLRVRRVE